MGLALHRAVSITCAVVAVGAFGTQSGLEVAEQISDGRGPLAAVWQLAGYFTNWSNFAVALVATAVALGLTKGLGGPRAIAAVLPAIVVVGVSYTLLLRGTLSDVSPAREVIRVIMHDITPPLFIALFVTSPHARLTWRDAPWALPLPLTYAVYSLIRGLFEGWFPYWFLDLTELPLTDFLRNAVLFVVAFYLLGLLVVAMDRALAFRRTPA